MHVEIQPAIHYWGTPVVLLSTVGEDGKVNVAPMSSVWWLGWSAMLGLDASSKTVENLRARGECVMNLCDVSNAPHVDRLARTTASRRVPAHKRLLGYEACPDKLERGELTPLEASSVEPPRLAECPVHLEGRVASIRPFAHGDPRMAIPACAVEVQILRVHAVGSLLARPDHVDPEAWKPLLMSFRELFALGPRAAPSRLAHGPEARYAPWKGGLATRAAGALLGALTQRRFGIPDEETPT